MNLTIQRSGLAWAALTALGFGTGTAALDAAQEPSVIHGSKKQSEAFEARFVLLVPDRPVRRDEDAYDPPTKGPDGEALLAERFLPLELVWDFGDGTTVTSRERVSMTHIYPDHGTYTVTVAVKDDRGQFDTATYETELINRDPHEIRVAAVEIDPDQSIVEFTATAQDVDGDPLWLTWEFGDGETKTGTLDEVWSTRHQYLFPGTYEVKLTVDDRDGEGATKEDTDGVVEKTKKIVVTGAATGPNPLSEEPDGEPSTEVVTSGLTGTVGGAVSAEIDAEIRSLYGIHLTKIEPGVCRFVFTAWDPTHLAHFMGLADLFGMPPQGAKYTIGNPRMVAFFEESATAYRSIEAHSFGGAGPGGLGGVAEREAAAAAQSKAKRELTDAELRALRREAARAGIDPQARIPREARPMPATSPHVDESMSWSTRSGNLDLTFIPGDRAVGTYALTMEDGIEGEVSSVTFEGELTVDLVAARRDGILIYEGCEPPPFAVEAVWPREGHRHLIGRRPPVRVTFDGPFDPETLTKDTFQVAFTAPEGKLVPVAGKILRDVRSAHFVPDENLLPGVEYTARVKVGDGGVRSRAGSPLADDQETGWRSWRFWTRLDFVPDADDGQLLACHLYQTARDVPLIAGKPVIARVWANWEEQPGVHPDHQVREFEPKIVLKGGAHEVLTEQVHRFVRPDLQKQMGIDRRSARHTAQVTGWTPRVGERAPVWVELHVPSWPGQGPETRYTAQCPMKMWDKAPELTIDFRALAIDEWAEGTAFEAVQPVLDSLAEAVVEYSWQLFPFAEVRRSGPVQPWRPEGLKVCRCPAENETGPYLGESGCSEDRCNAGDGGHGVAAVLVVDETSGVEGAWFHPDFGAGGLVEGTDTWAGIKDRMRTLSTADVVVVFAPHRFAVGGHTSHNLRSGRGVVMSLGSPESQNFSQYVEGAVHELGHVLDLEHLPHFETGPQRDALGEIREGSPAMSFEGIEGLRMSRDGETWWNKSSEDGNEEDERLGPLMFPGTVDREAIFIENHHYRKIQRLLDDLK